MNSVHYDYCQQCMRGNIFLIFVFLFFRLTNGNLELQMQFRARPTVRKHKAGSIIEFCLCAQSDSCAYSFIEFNALAYVYS